MGGRADEDRRIMRQRRECLRLVWPLLSCGCTALSHPNHLLWRSTPPPLSPPPPPLHLQTRRLLPGSLALSSLLLSPSASHAAEQFEPRGITAEDTVVFIIGCVPFVWAGIEFWRRSACLHSLLLLVLFPSLSPRHAKVCCTPAHNSRRVRMPCLHTVAVGDPFGTGQDSVIINDSSGNRPKPVRRVLGQDAIIAARILFALAFASGALVLIAGADVLNLGTR